MRMSHHPGNKVDFYLDDEKAGEITTNVPTDGHGLIFQAFTENPNGTNNPIVCDDVTAVFARD